MSTSCGAAPSMPTITHDTTVPLELRFAGFLGKLRIGSVDDARAVTPPPVPHQCHRPRTALFLRFSPR